MSNLAPTIYNVALTTQNTEYAQQLPADARRIRFQLRTAVDLRYAFTTGLVATPTAPYMTLKSGQVYTMEIQKEQIIGQPTIYFAAASGSLVVELEVWS
jgi:hypothetical protein